MNFPRKFALALAGAVPLVVWGLSSGPAIRRTGAPVDDNGTTCNVCHRGNDLNSPGGFVRIEAVPYRAGQRQNIRVTVSHPEAQRWGFQLTARLASDLTRKAGVFGVSPGSAVKVRCAPDGRDSSPTDGCGNDVEFAEHGGTPESTLGGVNGAKTFDVEWMPPEGVNVGDVVFYAAGNAANGNNANSGDRIYTTSLRIQGENACSFMVQPRVQGIGNAGTSRGNIAANTLLSIYGVQFVPSGVRQTADAGVIRDNKFPTELSCIAVEVAGQRVPVYHVQQDQINIQVPTTTQTGNLPVRVIVNPGRGSEVSVSAGNITLQNYAPAFFTFNGTSVAARLGGAATVIADPSVVPGARPAFAGEIIEIYGTGFGPSNPVYQAGEISPNTMTPLRDPITVTVGNTTLAAADVLYAGLAPGSISGLYQLNIRLPSTLTAGNAPVSITVGGVTSPSGTTIPIQNR